jgi:hypothetical protein
MWQPRTISISSQQLEELFRRLEIAQHRLLEIHYGKEQESNLLSSPGNNSLSDTHIRPNPQPWRRHVFILPRKDNCRVLPKSRSSSAFEKSIEKQSEIESLLCT